jgi:GPH family glycoside/pentoside/hexuronide:cation symporter
MYQITKEAAQGKQVIITETGWPNDGDHSNLAVPSEMNSMRYFVNAQNWAKAQNVELFYFSAFDETWKIKHEGSVGDQWGIWDKNEQLKYQ